MKRFIGISTLILGLSLLWGCSTTGAVLKQAQAYESLPAQEQLQKTLEAAVNHRRTVSREPLYMSPAQRGRGGLPRA